MRYTGEHICLLLVYFVGIKINVDVKVDVKVDVGNSVNVCVLLGNESNKATATKYIFKCLFCLPQILWDNE